MSGKSVTFLVCASASAPAPNSILAGTSRGQRRSLPMRTKSILTLSAILAALGAAHAEAPPAPATPMAETAAPKPQRSAECAPVKPSPSGPNASEGTTAGEQNEALGDKLAKSNGVLCPPADIDPEMRAPTPDTGNTPVIPPPGSPGGNPNVQPK